MLAAASYVQCSEEKHDGHADLFRPVQLELGDLAQRDANHPNVEGDADGGVGPAKGVDVDAPPRRVRLDVLRPEVVDGGALEDGGDDKGRAVEGVGDDGGPEQPPDRLAREDADVEERQAELDERQLREVQHLHDVQPLGKRGQLVRRQRPGVLAQAVGSQAPDVDDDARDADGQRDQDDLVVGGEAHVCGEELLKHQPGHDEQDRDCPQGNGHGDVLAGPVANGGVARRGRDVLGRWAARCVSTWDTRVGVSRQRRLQRASTSDVQPWRMHFSAAS